MRNSGTLLILAAFLTLVGLTTPCVVSGQTMQQATARNFRPCDAFAVRSRPNLKRRGPTSESPSSPVEEQQIPGKCEDRDGQVKELVGLRFVGLESFHESYVTRLIQEAGVGLRADQMPDAETADKAAAVLKKLLSTKGHVYAVINAIRDEQFNSVTFHVTEGVRIPLADLRFEGNKVFSAAELKTMTMGCLSNLGKSDDEYDQELLEYCLRGAANSLRNRGYLQAKFGEPRSEIIGNRIVVTVRIEEGSLYRLGKITIEGADPLSAEDIRAMLPLSQGEVVADDSIGKWLFDDLKKSYADRGYIQYTAEPVPDFRDASEVEGVVDFKVMIEEGERFTLRSIELEGAPLPTAKLLNESPLQPGDIYNASAFAAFVNQLNQAGLFEPIDKDKDSHFRVNAEERLVSIRLRLRKRSQH